MVNWKSPATIGLDAGIFVKFMHSLIGLYLWEWFISLDFEWSYISGKRKFRWPLIFYFLCRYAQLLTLIGTAVAFNVTTEIHCQPFYSFLAAMGNLAIGTASINLSLRTMAVWGRKPYIVIPLVVLILGHWTLLFHGILLKSSWDPVNGGCVITQTNNTILSATFIYSMCFDFIVLCLTGYKLYFLSSGRSRLVNLIVRDGLMYFIVAFVANLIATTFILLQLNAIMSVIANVPAGIAATIMATRAVRRLVNIQSEGAEMFTGATRMTGIAFKSNGSKTMIRSKEGVHVQTSTEKFDAAGSVINNTVFDPEDQVISNEFKRGPL